MAPDTPPPAGRWEEMTRRVAGLAPLLDPWLGFLRWYRQIPSLAVGVAVDGHTVYAAGHGWADVAARRPAGPDTPYRIASHSKVFTATALMQLVAEGRLQLDDPVSRHLSWFGSGDAGGLAGLTLRQLLSHSAGITRDGATTHWHDGRFPDRDAIVAQAGTLEVLGPVEALKYSNIGYTVLGLVIEAVTGSPYEEHVTRAVLEPLGLAATTPDLPASEAARPAHATGYGLWRPGRERPELAPVPARAMNSATGFSSTVHDLLRWYQAHLLGNGELFDDRHKREMQRVQFEGEGARWGLGFHLTATAGLDFCAHGGGYPGFITFSGVNQEHRLAVVVLTNAIDGPAGQVFAGIVNLVKRALDGQFDAPAPPTTAGTAEPGDGAGPDTPGRPPEPAELDRVAGFYPTQWGDELVARAGHRLVVVAPESLDPSATLQILEPVAGLRFRYPRSQPTASPGEELWFDPGDPPVLHAPSMPPLPRVENPHG